MVDVMAGDQQEDIIVDMMANFTYCPANVSLASSPDKETLVTLLPFFADTESGAPSLPLPPPHTASSQSRSLFSRRRSSNTSQPSANLVL